MIKQLFFLTLLCVTILYSRPSLALAKLGHQVICQLAFKHLPLAKQQRITLLLSVIPSKHKALINQYNHLKKDTVISFANACTWADAIKSKTKFKQYKTWHYLNVARDKIAINKAICKKNCLPQAIIKHQQQLKTSPISWQATQALLFLGHWLGDIHQPLHVSYASDLGGNKVTFDHQRNHCENLHWYWDSCLIKTAKRTKKHWIKYLTQQWHKITIPAFYSQQVWRWADESYQLIREPSFQYCQLNKQNSCLRPTKKITLAADYSQQYLPIMEQQLLKAAKRLTRLLEQSL